MKPVIVDKSASEVNALVKEARKKIALIVVNPITLLVIALSQRLFNHNSHFNIYVSSYLILAETVSFWTIDSTATDHVARDRISFVEFR